MEFRLGQNEDRPYKGRKKARLGRALKDLCRYPELFHHDEHEGANDEYDGSHDGRLLEYGVVALGLLFSEELFSAAGDSTGKAAAAAGLKKHARDDRDGSDCEQYHHKGSHFSNPPENK